MVYTFFLPFRRYYLRQFLGYILGKVCLSVNYQMIGIGVERHTNAKEILKAQGVFN